MDQSLERIKTALVALRKGKIVILLDDESKENEGDLIFPAEKITPKILNFISTEARGLSYLALDHDKAEALRLPLMTETLSASNKTATLSIDAKRGIKTGSSAQDRAETIKTAINPKAEPGDLITPGHVFPLQACKNGVLERRGHTEGAIDLMSIAKLDKSAIISPILNFEGDIANQEELKFFSKKQQCPIVTIRDIVHYRLYYEKLIEIQHKKDIETSYGVFTCLSCVDKVSKNEHFALVKGRIKNGSLVRIHQGCLEGDVFSSKSCNCKKNLQTSLEAISKEESGILFYQPEQIKAPNVCLNYNPHNNSYVVASQLLRKFEINAVHLLMTDSNDINGLKSFGISVIAKTKL